MLENNHEYEKMAKLEGTHWWYVSLHALCRSALRTQEIPLNAPILDAGCGTGGVLESLKTHGFNNLKGFDLSQHAIAVAQSRKLRVYQDNLANLANTQGPYKVIFCNDVLYFFDQEERLKILKQLHSLLTKDGLLVLNVPTFKLFRGSHDSVVGIKNRFERRHIAELLSNLDVKVISVTYWPLLLSPIILSVRLFQRFRSRVFSTRGLESDIKQHWPLLNNLFAILTNFENRFLKKKGFGSSAFIILRKR